SPRLQGTHRRAYGGTEKPFHADIPARQSVQDAGSPRPRRTPDHGFDRRRHRRHRGRHHRATAEFKDCIMTKIALVVSDVDGTLVTHDKRLTDKAKAAVKRLEDNGIVFTITSSRPPVG